MNAPVHTTLRPYQVHAFDELAAGMRAKVRRQLLVSPTGSGKGTTIGEMIRRATGKGKRVLFLVAGRQLVSEFSQRIDRQYGIDHGVIMAGHHRCQPWHPVQIASIDTLASHVRNGKPLPAADLVIIDEADMARAARFEVVLERYPDAYIVGSTATPWRNDGKGLADLFDRLVLAATPRELIDAGFLVDYGGYSMEPPEVALAMAGGDFDMEALDEAYAGAKGDALDATVVTEWLARCGTDPTRHVSEDNPGRRSVVFCRTRRHAQALTERFLAAEIPTAYLDGDSSLGDRDELFASVTRGDVRVVCNVNVLARGVDVPALEVCVWVRPTKSVSLYLQQAGRVFRPSPQTGKRFAYFLDFAGNGRRHGAPDKERPYGLTADAATESDAERVASITRCECGTEFSSARKACPLCGKPRAAEEEPEQQELPVNVELVATPIKDLPTRGPSPEDIRDSFRLSALVRQALAKWPEATGEERAKKLRWAGHRFAGKDESRMPSDETLEKIARAELRKLSRRGGLVVGGMR